MVLQGHLAPMVLLGNEVLQVNPVRMEPKEIQDHVGNGEKLVLQVLQDLRVKMAKMVLLENLVQTDFLELQEKGVCLDSEDLLEQMAFQEKRVLLGSVVAQAPQGPEELLESLDEMASLEVQD